MMFLHRRTSWKLGENILEKIRILDLHFKLILVNWNVQYLRQFQCKWQNHSWADQNSARNLYPGAKRACGSCWEEPEIHRERKAATKRESFNHEVKKLRDVFISSTWRDLVAINVLRSIVKVHRLLYDLLGPETLLRMNTTERKRNRKTNLAYLYESWKQGVNDFLLLKVGFRPRLNKLVGSLRETRSRLWDGETKSIDFLLIFM